MAAITFEADADTLAQIERLANWRGVTRDEYVAAAIRHVLTRDADFHAKVQQGIDELERGEGISQDDMEAWFEARYRPAAAE